MPVDLPPQVLQGLGIPLPVSFPQAAGAPQQIPPLDDSLPGLPQPEQGAPLPELPPIPQQQAQDLATHAGPPEIARPQGSPDFVVPPSAFGHPGSGAPTPAGVAAAQALENPPPPQVASHASRGAQQPSPDQLLANARLRSDEALADSINAQADKGKAEIGLAREQLASQKAYEDKVAEIQKQQLAWNADYQKTLAQKQAHVEQTLRAVDSYKVDQNKFANQLGIGGTLGWGIAAVLAGVGQALQRQGGPNPVIQMMQEKAKQAIAAQLDEREQLKERNARAEHELDKFRQFSSDRNAQFLALQAQADKFLANQFRTAELKAAEPLAKARAGEAAGKLETEAAGKATEAAKFAAERDNQEKRLAVERSQLGVSQFNAGETKRHNLATEGLTGEQRDLEALKLSVSSKNDTAKLVRERAIGGEVTLIKDASGKVTGYETGPITKKDGSVWIPQGTEPVVTEFQKGHEAALRLLSTIDEIRKLGPEFLSNTANSPKLQQLKQQMADARLEAIKYHGLGVPTGHDVELAEGSIGTSDPTRFKDSTAGLNKARDSIIRNLNISMRARGLDKEWEGPLDPLKLPAAAPSQLEQISTVLKAKPNENPQRARDEAFNTAYRANGGDLVAARTAGEVAAEAARSGLVTPEQQKGIDELKAKAAAGGDGAQDALAALQDVAKTAASKRVRQLAEETLSEIRSAGAQSGQSLTVQPLNYDPNGYNPQQLVDRFHRVPHPTLQP